MGKHLKTPVSFRFSEEELAMLDEAAIRYGSKQAAIVAGLRALRDRGQPNVFDALAVIESALAKNVGREMVRATARMEKRRRK